MGNRFLFFLPLQFILISAIGQQITQQDADSMLLALKKSKQDIHRIELLLHLAQFHIFKPGEEQKDFDSAKLYINEASVVNKTVKSPAATGYLLLTESYLIKEKGQADEGKKMAEKSVKILQSADNKYYLGRAYYELSMYYGYQELSQRLEKSKLVERSIAAFRQAGKLERNAYSLEMLGELYQMLNDFPRSIEVLKEALSAYESIKHTNLQGVYILLGQAYQFQYNETQALFYMLKALKTAHAVRDSSMQLCQINNILGVLYKRIDNKEMSVKYLNDALEIAKKHGDEYSIFLLATNIAVPYNELDQPGKAITALESIPGNFIQKAGTLQKTFLGIAYLQAYTGLKQYDKASAYCDTLLKLATSKTMSDQMRYNIYFMAATYYIATKQYAKARLHLTKSTSIPAIHKNRVWEIQDARLWYKLDSAEANYESAFKYLHKYKTKMDSMFSANRVKQ